MKKAKNDCEDENVGVYVKSSLKNTIEIATVVVNKMVTSQSSRVAHSPTWTTFMESNIPNRNSTYLIRNDKGRPKTRQEIQARTLGHKNQTTNTNAMKKILQEFTNNTTLLGLSHYLKTHNVLWLIAWAICLAIGIAQSWNVAQDLFNNTGTQKIEISNEPYVSFPSVTICSYNLLPEEFLKKHEIPRYKNLSTDAEFICSLPNEEDDEDSYEVKLRENDNVLLNFIRKNLTKERRFELSCNITSMFQKCYINENSCNFSDPNLFYIFNNPYYGNCITFNPGFDPETALLADIYTKLNVIFKVDNKGWLRVGSWLPRVGVLFHNPGTAPVLESSTVYDLRPGDSTEFTLKLSEIQFNKQLSSGCIDKTELNHRRASYYYNESSTPYLYSIEACMKTCYQKHAIKKCRKIDPIVPVQDFEHNKTIRTESPPITCTEIDEKNINMKTCDCPLPCSFIQYATNPDTTTLEDTCKTNKTKKQLRTRFSVNFLTTIKEVVREEQEYSLAQFFGILGGNLSLSVGLCIISLLEILELGWNLIALLIIPNRSAQVLNRHASSRSYTYMSVFKPFTKLSSFFKRSEKNT